MIERKPVAALALSTIGLALLVLNVVLSTYLTSYWWGTAPWRAGAMVPGMMGGMMIGMMGGMMIGMMGGFWPPGSPWFLPSTVITAVVVAVSVIGVLWINTGNPIKVRTGAILVLISSVIAFPTMMGFTLGSLLMLIGGILGLVWQPPVTKET